MNIPNLNNLIKVIECNNQIHNNCEHCLYNYQYYDNSGDFWSCNEDKIIDNSYFYLKLYQHLIEEQNA